MNVFKPLQATLLHKPFEFKGKQQLAVTLMFGFPFDGGEPLLEPELWNFIAAEIGKNGILDLGMPKPNGEVLVYGNYFAPKGTPIKADAVRMKIGKIDKSLLVFGDRYWRALLGPTEPEPFSIMPLDYAHAFGGEGCAKNPMGKGIVDVDVFGERRRPLPNIEHPDQVITSSGQRPDPAGFGPLDMRWEFRAAKLGTYNDKWLKERWPAYPDDLDWNHFNAAPPDQWLEEFFTGDEAFELTHMHPEKPLVKGRLPALRARCFMQRSSSGAEEVEEITMRAETVWLFPHSEIGIVLYRGVIGIQTDDASDVLNLIVGYERLGETPRKATHYATALAKRRDPAQADNYLMNTTDLIPSGARCGLGAVAVPEPLPEPPNADASKKSADWRETAMFPRPPGLELINDLIAGKQQAHELRKNAAMVPAPEMDVEEIRAKLDDAGREMKEGYRAQAHLLEEGRPAHEQHLQRIRDALLERLETNKCVTGWDLAGLDLSNRDFSGVDFSGCYLEAVDFTRSKLTHANLEGAILAFANLAGCDLSGANLKRANLGAADLTDTVLDGADMTETVLGRSILSRAKLTQCNMTGVDLHEADLAGADLSGSTLPNGQFIDMDISRASFRNTTLTGSTFTNCVLEESDFSQATLDESTWIESTLNKANFCSARMSNCRFVGGTSLQGARFVRAVLDSSNLRETDLRDADFTEANLTTCDFGASNAQRARFTRSIAKRAQFIGADLGGADLSSMNLMEGTLMKARLTSASLRNANCYGVEFMNATVGETDFSGAILDQTKLQHWRPSR